MLVTMLFKVSSLWESRSSTVSSSSLAIMRQLFKLQDDLDNVQLEILKTQEGDSVML